MYDVESQRSALWTSMSTCIAVCGQHGAPVVACCNCSVHRGTFGVCISIMSASRHDNRARVHRPTPRCCPVRSPSMVASLLVVWHGNIVVITISPLCSLCSDACPTACSLSHGLHTTLTERIPIATRGLLARRSVRFPGANVVPPLGQALAQSPREICHSYTTFNTCYNDTGLFGIYAVARRE